MKCDEGYITFIPAKKSAGSFFSCIFKDHKQSGPISKEKGVDRCKPILTRSGTDMGLSYAKEVVSISSAV